MHALPEGRDSESWCPRHVRAWLRLCTALGCRTLSSPSAITTATIIARIVANRAQYEARNARKNKSEAAYYKAKQHVNEV